MLCEGSPLLFYTTSGPVTPPGMHHGEVRLDYARWRARWHPVACPPACLAGGGSIVSVLDNQPQLRGP